MRNPRTRSGTTERCRCRRTPGSPRAAATRARMTIGLMFLPRAAVGHRLSACSILRRSRHRRMLMTTGGVSATISAFHTASPDNKYACPLRTSHATATFAFSQADSPIVSPCSPFTVYVLTLKKGPMTWQVFRRYREWEDLRMRLIQQLGSAPPMPPKTLFGRMRPEASSPCWPMFLMPDEDRARAWYCIGLFEQSCPAPCVLQVIENRVLGLNHFLQLCLGTPLYASHRALSEFLEKNNPPAVRATCDVQTLPSSHRPLPTILSRGTPAFLECAGSRHQLARLLARWRHSRHSRGCWRGCTWASTQGASQCHGTGAHRASISTPNASSPVPLFAPFDRPCIHENSRHARGTLSCTTKHV
jgi:hypothetical protein